MYVCSACFVSAFRWTSDEHLVRKLLPTEMALVSRLPIDIALEKKVCAREMSDREDGKGGRGG